MIQPDDIVNTINSDRNRIGDSYSLGNVVDAIERIVDERIPIDDDLEPGLVFVAGRFDHDKRHRFDIGIYPSYSLFQPIEILLAYPIGLRNWTLKKFEGEHLEFSKDNGIDLLSIRRTKWFRRYKNVRPAEFVCRMKSAEELEETAQAMSRFFDSGL